MRLAADGSNAPDVAPPSPSPRQILGVSLPSARGPGMSAADAERAEVDSAAAPAVWRISLREKLALMIQPLPDLRELLRGDVRAAEARYGKRVELVSDPPIRLASRFDSQMDESLGADCGSDGPKEHALEGVVPYLPHAGANPAIFNPYVVIFCGLAKPLQVG